MRYVLKEPLGTRNFHVPLMSPRHSRQRCEPKAEFNLRCFMNCAAHLPESRCPDSRSIQSFKDSWSLKAAKNPVHNQKSRSFNSDARTFPDSQSLSAYSFPHKKGRPVIPGRPSSRITIPPIFSIHPRENDDYFIYATSSTSQSIPFGRDFTATQLLAGLEVKYFS